MTSTPYLRDVLTIPERVDAADFVLQLQSGVAAAGRTLDEYVVTSALAESFDRALSLVERTIAGGQSKGAFIHGSFGSGKSHFMAVLHLLLTGNPDARALPGLQEVVAARQGVLGRNVLAIDYHLLGKESFEAAIFGGYLETVARLHPEAPAPVLHQTDALLADAAGLRARLGDEEFLGGLGGSGASAGWGARRGGAWTAESYAAAAAAPAGDARRDALVTALVGAYFSGYTRAGQWLDTAAGLRAMTEHAKGLGYDGVVLFLDELVLWLAQHLGDSEFIQNESSKVAKLVETEMTALPVPLVSFVARQRDLKDFLGSNATGAVQVAIGDSFRWWEDRFDRIELAAADLPQIVHKRLLEPVSDDAALAIRAAVDRVRADSASWGYLLTDAQGSGADAFQLTYPFSPALVDAMIALSALMQRERTALRLMGELLAAGRGELTVNDVIPVGDLFDVVVMGGSQPLTQVMTQHFAHARQWYEAKFRPWLLDKHGLTDAAARSLPRTHAFRTQDRLAKTLLVAFLAPGTPSLASLTFAKLAALNYGTVASFVPGQQAQMVGTHVRQWAAEFGEVQVGEGANPVVSLTLTGVDHDALLDSVQHEDTEPNRRALLRRLLTGELGVAGSHTLVAEWTTTVVWRGAKREVDVLFGNVRDDAELPNDALRASSGRWKVVIDVPFDAGDHTAQEDLNRIHRLREDGFTSATLIWLPHFFTAARMADVGKLTTLEYLLTGERFDQSASRLNPGEREPARQALENQRRSLRERVLESLRQAYGVSAAKAENVDTQLLASEVLTTLLPGVGVAPPVAATLRAALESALRQALDAQYPQHPRFELEADFRRADLAAVLDSARTAIDAGGRLDGVDRARAGVLRRIAEPLRCGRPRETVFHVAPQTFGWLDDFTRWSAEAAAGGDLRVADLRVRLQPYGMVSDVEDLLIAVWAALEDREWSRGGTVLPAPGIGQVTGDMVLRAARLPSVEEWQAAVRAAGPLFGVAAPPRRSAAGVSALARDLRVAVQRFVTPARELVAVLEAHAALLGVVSGAGRLGTAQHAADLLDRLSREGSDLLLLQVLAGAELPAEPQALGTSMATAADVAGMLRRADWDLLGRAPQLAGGEAALAGLRDAAAREELHVRIGPVLGEAITGVRDLLLRQVTPSPATVEPATPAPGASDTSDATGGAGTSHASGVDDIELVIEDAGALDALVGSLREASSQARTQGKRLRVRWWLE